ncbi:MAG: SGNH/GDSL hydrolase family protein [Neisseriaceae bacterium]
MISVQRALSYTCLFFALNSFSYATDIGGNDSERALPQFTSLVVFGDSLSDQGGSRGRFDYFVAGGLNNPNYVRILSPILTHQTSLPYTRGGNNFAESGAHTLHRVRDTEKQIQRYLKKVQYRADPAALYIMNIGGNDLHEKEVFSILMGQAIMKLFTHHTLPLKLPGPEGILEQLQTLNTYGAKNFLVPNLWRPSYSPALAYQAPRLFTALLVVRLFKLQSRDLVALLNIVFNQKFEQLFRGRRDLDGGGLDFFKEKSTELLANELSWLPKSAVQRLEQIVFELTTEAGDEYYSLIKEKLEASSLNILYADTHRLLDEIYLNPKSFGIDNVLLTQCSVGLSSSSSFCDLALFNHTDRTYLWSDAIHPSPAANIIFAQYYLSLLNAASYVSSIQFQLHTLAHSSQAFITDILNQWRYNMSSKPLEPQFFVNLSGEQRSVLTYAGTSRINAALLHLGVYIPLSSRELVGASLSSSLGQAHPFRQFQFRYDYLGASLFHQFQKGSIWFQDQLQWSGLYSKDIKRSIQLGKLKRLEHAKGTLSTYWGFHTMLGYEFLKTPQVAAGFFLKGSFEGYESHGYIEEANHSTSMRFGNIHITKPSTAVGLYHRISASTPRPWSLYTQLSYQKSTKVPYRIPINVKSFRRNYQTTFKDPFTIGWRVASTFSYELSRKVSLQANVQYEQNKGRNHAWSGQIGVKFAI